MKRRFIIVTIITATSFLNGCAFVGGTKVYTNPDYAPGDIEYLQVKMPSLPELPATDWLNASPDIVDSLRGKVVLVDFWDYTCVNCIRTLPYLKEWYKRYAKDGLVIIGIHSPEFLFARKRANLEKAVEQFGLKYPMCRKDRQRPQTAARERTPTALREPAPDDRCQIAGKHLPAC